MAPSTPCCRGSGPSEATRRSLIPEVRNRRKPPSPSGRPRAAYRAPASSREPSTSRCKTSSTDSSAATASTASLTAFRVGVSRLTISGDDSPRRRGEGFVVSCRARHEPSAASRRASMTAAKTFVALLRGINVGGRNKVSMPELKSSLASLGLEDVVTYIQSGNVVFRSPTGGGQELAARIERQIGEVFGVRPTVLLRTPVELLAIADGN